MPSSGTHSRGSAQRTAELPAALTKSSERAESALERFLPPQDQPPVELHRAMRYAVLGGGKRLRPMLAYATGAALGAALEHLDAMRLEREATRIAAPAVTGPPEATPAST
jgi:farnesyl diphosphate synthase